MNKVIVVDDQQHLLTYYSRVLEATFGHRIDVITCQNGYEALELVKSLNWIDDVLCVVTDFNMPFLLWMGWS